MVGFATEGAANAPQTINLKLYGVRPSRRRGAHSGACAWPAADDDRRATACRERGRAMPENEAEAAVAAFFFIQVSDCDTRPR